MCVLECTNNLSDELIALINFGGRRAQLLLAALLSVASWFLLLLATAVISEAVMQTEPASTLSRSPSITYKDVIDEARIQN